MAACVLSTHLRIQLGTGGAGAAALEPTKSTLNGPPSGGNGGQGGHVYFQTNPLLTSLVSVPKRIRAGDGYNGKGSYQHGKKGKDLTVEIPLGTVIKEISRETEMERIARDQEAMGIHADDSQKARREKLFVVHPSAELGESDWQLAEDILVKAGRLPQDRSSRKRPMKRRDGALPLEDEKLDMDISKPLKEPLLVSRGGLGGYGNPHFINNDNPFRSPRVASRGMTPDILTLTLELKMLADVGLVGFPNAGKSTILRALTGRKAEVAGYQFTTLNPQIGVVKVMDDGTWEGGLPDGEIVEETWKERETEAANIEFSDTRAPRTDEGVEVLRFTISDNPGLLPQASENVGLGHSFLRSIERSLALVYVLDLNRAHPEQDLMSLRHELEAYKTGLAAKGKMIILNKADEVDEAQGRERIEAVKKILNTELKGDGLELMTISGKYNLGLKKVVQKLSTFVAEAREVQAQQEAEAESAAQFAEEQNQVAAIEAADVQPMDPLRPNVPTSPHGLPLEPSLPPRDILYPPAFHVTSDMLTRLHRLSAMTPPERGSEEETRLKKGLSHLIGLMDQVKDVTLDGVEPDGSNREEAIRRLLTEGSWVGEGQLFDAPVLEAEQGQREEEEDAGDDRVVGKELMKWKTEAQRD